MHSLPLHICKDLVLVCYRYYRYPGCTTRTSVPSQPTALQKPSYKKEPYLQNKEPPHHHRPPPPQPPTTPPHHRRPPQPNPHHTTTAAQPNPTHTTPPPPPPNTIRPTKITVLQKSL